MDKLLSSTTFSGSERHRRFLAFVVDQALKGDTDKLNEFVLGFEVFDKNASFDPRIDSIVRVEARRLRERLKKYYDEEGKDDAIVVTLRPRSFVPEFHEPSTPGEPAGEGWRRWLPSPRTSLLALTAVLFGAAVTVAALSFRQKRPAPPKTASILVLPFQALSPAASQALLGDAITDAIITGLAGSPGLRVISRGSGIQFKESGRPPYPFASDLQVDYIVEGTVRADAVRARVSAKMTDVRSQSYLWADTREINLDALGALERELTSAISSRIRIPLPPDSGDRVMRRRAANGPAYVSFLKGQYYWYQQDRGSTETSVRLFEEATRGDPNYAPAWAWLSQGYHLMILHDDGRDAALIARGRQAAQKALALDDHLAESHAAMGSYAALDWDWSGAEREFRRALELNPEWAQGHLMYAMLYLVPTGQTGAAVREMRRAHELDPLTKTTRTMLAEALYFNREYARVISETEDLRKPASNPSPEDRRYFLSLHLSGQGRRALDEIRQVTSSADEIPPATALLGYLLATNGERQQATVLFQRLLKQSKTNYISPLSIAMVSVGLGDLDETFRQLNQAVSRHIPSVCQAAVDPVFDPIRSDPRFDGIARSLGVKPNR